MLNIYSLPGAVSGKQLFLLDALPLRAGLPTLYYIPHLLLTHSIKWGARKDEKRISWHPLISDSITGGGKVYIFSSSLVEHFLETIL